MSWEEDIAELAPGDPCEVRAPGSKETWEKHDPSWRPSVIVHTEGTRYTVEYNGRHLDWPVELIRKPDGDYPPPEAVDKLFCSICTRTLHGDASGQGADFEDPARNCGGDCWACVAPLEGRNLDGSPIDDGWEEVEARLGELPKGTLLRYAEADGTFIYGTVVEFDPDPPGQYLVKTETGELRAFPTPNGDGDTAFTMDPGAVKSKRWG